VEGGAATVVDAFLDAGTTLLVPTFGGSRYAVTAPPDLRPSRNGISYDGWTDQGGLPVDPAAADFAGREFTTADNYTLMGAIPAEVLTRPGRQRGNHPLNSFAAIGPGAAELIRGQTPADVYAPLAALAGQGGLVVLAGVGLTSMTLLHYAEQVAGRVLLRRWALAGGKVVMVAVGGCSDGFERFAGALGPTETTATVGRSHWRIFPAAPSSTSPRPSSAGTRTAPGAPGLTADSARTRPSAGPCSRADRAGSALREQHRAARAALSESRCGSLARPARHHRLPRPGRCEPHIVVDPGIEHL
jgi:aminoglycoside 3-N-acetyltransferase